MNMSQTKKKLINKTAFNIAKNLANQSLKETGEIELDDAALAALEDEVLWERSETNKSDVVERNLTQMIDVLHLRLKSLEGVVNIRKELSNEDSNRFSKLSSTQAPTITDDFDEINPRVLKDTRAHLHKVGLVKSHSCLCFIFRYI